MSERLPEDHFLIRELVDSYVDDWKARAGQRDHQKRGGFYVSDVSKCDRSIFYDFKCPENKRPISPKTLMLFAAGNLLHEDLQDRAKRRGMLESARDIEYGLEDFAFKTTGRLDCIAAVYKFIETEKGIAVVEIKTKNPYGFGGEDPTQEEVDQILWYIDRLLDSMVKSIKRQTVLPYGFILYADRSMSADPLPLAAWKIDYDPERMAVIKARFKALDKAIVADAIPQRPYERDSLKCAYCRYAAFCWEGVPLPAPAILEADPAIEAPEYELVESLASRYLDLQEQQKKLETEIDVCKDTFRKYFKARGVTEIPVNGNTIVYTASKTTSLDVPYLFSKLQDVWFEIASPQVSLIQRAIKDGKVDPEIFERAKVVDYQWQIRVKKSKKEKEENHADQKPV
jgi:CRISPR/Cas system-associated exonuclease Cas4 (RecB family)